MKTSRWFFLVLAAFVFTSACKTFKVENVNYAQQVESVLVPTYDGTVTDARYAISFNILPFQYQEMKDSSSVKVEKVRLIRNQRGYYFITANGFSNVYVMEPIDSGLRLKERIAVSETGLEAPAFNLRHPYIQLIDTKTSKIISLNEKGINKKEERES